MDEDTIYGSIDDLDDALTSPEDNDVEDMPTIVNTSRNQNGKCNAHIKISICEDRFLWYFGRNGTVLCQLRVDSCIFPIKSCTGTIGKRL